jgi:hypothetical protein
MFLSTPLTIADIVIIFAFGKAKDPDFEYDSLLVHESCIYYSSVLPYVAHEAQYIFKTRKTL